jgi:hypothetical protein
MKYITLALILLLTSCATLRFDANEFQSYITLQELSTSAVSSCGTPAVMAQVQQMQQIMNHQFLYVAYRELNTPAFTRSASELKIVIDGLVLRYNGDSVPSDAYCQEKLKNVSIGAAQLAREIGRL